MILLIKNICYSQSLKSDKFESEILNCLYEKYDSIDVNLKSELFKSEKYLIDTKQLKDNSGESYIKIFKEVSKINNIPLLINLDKCVIKKHSPENFHLFAKCFHSKKNNKELNNSYSKLKRIYTVLENKPNNIDNSISELAKGVLNVLDSNDFEKEFYRIWALNTFYFTADVTP